MRKIRGSLVKRWTPASLAALLLRAAGVSGYIAAVFGNLINFEPDVAAGDGVTLVGDADPGTIARAQVATADWLDEIGAPPADEVDEPLARKQARGVFGALTAGSKSIEEQRAHLLAIKSPEAVRHVAAMLDAYDWEFIEHAKQIRGMLVAKLVAETENPKAEVRLKAMQLLGKVTEVGLFTDKVEITKKDLSDEELDARIKEKLNRLQQVVDVTDVRPIEADAGKPAPDAQPD